ncbi:glycosyl hydrolase family 71-domain-containing protein [Cercophora newfieldiana]|uniref:Glycosyl hydrolase family 71-domain-containing protein n=1 Tax=Cercophora newfieldiana TaxID=92897 RepID=A0AA39Y8S2_9PEZI|nr:glycosyl hydrolase family 71-domain-containing protein [Cercophora newfieldiana]
MKTSLFWAAVGCLAAQVRAKAVFAHFMVGNSKTYTQADWEKDIQLAKDAHIDAFALNVANEIPELTPSLNIAFSVAATKGFKLFFSYDYAGLGAFSKDAAIKLCDDFCNKPAYYRFNGKPLLSTFEGSEKAEEWVEIKTRTKGFFVPDWSSQGAFGAIAKAGGSGGKPYMMPASPWFYTNLPTWDKNWLWRGDSLWFDRWNEILYNEPEFVEIISWNDFGESHHIGPLPRSTTGPDNYPHDGWRAFLPFVIDTYKNGVATITKEGLVGWWRRSAASACGDGETTGNTANQLQLEFAPGQVSQDKIFFTALLGSSADVSVTMGGTAVSASWTSKPDGGIGLYHGTASFTASHRGDVVITLRRGTTEAPGSISATPALKRSQMGCIQGTGTGNFKGLCEFNCRYNYCPISACTCTSLGAPIPEPQPQSAPGFPAAGLDENYSGLCAVACRLGYCPPTACSKTKQPLVVPTVSPFAPPACTKGEAIAAGELTGLCSYACNFGFCPRNVCRCTGQGVLNGPPAQSGSRGRPREGLKDFGLCDFACSRGYCPGPVCVGA